MNDLIKLLRGRRIDGRSADEIMRLAADEIESLQSQLSYRIEERDDSNRNLTSALRREVASKDRLAEAEAYGKAQQRWAHEWRDKHDALTAENAALRQQIGKDVGDFDYPPGSAPCMCYFSTAEDRGPDPIGECDYHAALRKDAERGIVTMSEQKLEHVNPMGSMFADAIRALAAIDAELGMPGDGCNSTQATLTAIRLLHSAHRDDVANNKRLATLLLESVSMIEGFRRAGWIMNGAWGDQTNDFIARVKRATSTVKEVRDVDAHYCLDHPEEAAASTQQWSRAMTHKCPDCHNEFVQPFVCTTCGAQKLYDVTVTHLHEQNESLRSRLAEAERLLRICTDTREAYIKCVSTHAEIATFLGAADSASVCLHQIHNGDTCEICGAKVTPVVQPERCCLDYPRCDCNSPPESESAE